MRNKKSELLNQLYAPYERCQSCPLAHLGRNNIVFGEGNPSASLMIIGEGPGAQEDIQKKPFVGKSGQLLTKVLETAGTSRDNVYITNIVKCRPPGNRNPLPIESTTCINLFLLNQIAIIQPKVICLLGACALRALISPANSITKARGVIIQKGSINIIPTFHPAYILRNRTKLGTFYNDIQLAVDLSNS